MSCFVFVIYFREKLQFYTEKSQNKEAVESLLCTQR